MTAEIKVRLDNIKATFKDMAQLASQGVLVGIAATDAKRKDGKITNAQIGYINEFGSPRQGIPPRPFLNPALQEAAPELAKLMQPDFENLESTKHLDKAGLYAVTQVRRHITEQIGMAPLSPLTIKNRQRKRKSGQAGTKALYDTGNLLQSINYHKEE